MSQNHQMPKGAGMIERFTQDKFNLKRAEHDRAIFESVAPQLKNTTGFEIADVLISSEFATAICDEFNYTFVHSRQLMKYVFSPR